MCVNSDGATFETEVWAVRSLPDGVPFTVTVAGPGSISGGTMKLIWPEDAKNKLAGQSLPAASRTLTARPAREDAGNGAATVSEASLTPKAAATEPGAS